MIDHMSRYEKIWLLIGISSIIVFLVILGIMGVGLGLNPLGHMRTMVPEEVTTMAPFNQPALK